MITNHDRTREQTATHSVGAPDFTSSRSRRVFGPAWVAGLIVFVQSWSLQAATSLSTNLPPVTAPELPEATFSIIRVFGALTLVLALFLVGVWVFKNWHRVALQRGRPQQLQLMETRSLGGRHALHVVGYQGQRLLLASSPNGVSLISHLPSGEAEPAAEKPANQNFVHVLQQAIQQKP